MDQGGTIGQSGHFRLIRFAQASGVQRKHVEHSHQPFFMQLCERKTQSASNLTELALQVEHMSAWAGVSCEGVIPSC